MFDKDRYILSIIEAILMGIGSVTIVVSLLKHLIDYAAQIGINHPV